MSDNKKTTPTESDVYDRQIRLWGAESQAKMKSSKVLYIHVTGTSAEVLKNLVLAGIAATLCDPRPVEAMDSAPHFFTPPPAKKKIKYSSVAHAVQPLVEDLNMLLGDCPILDKQIVELTEDDIKDFTVIVASQIPLVQATRLAQFAAKHGKPFYLADCFGFYGSAMMDLGKVFQYRREQGKSLLDPEPLKEYIPFETLASVPLSQATNRFHKVPPKAFVYHKCLLAYQEKTGEWPTQQKFDVSIFEEYLKAQNVDSVSAEEMQGLGKAGMAQIPAVCSVLGGLLGNEIIKAISGKGEPANNTLLVDGTSCKVWTFLVKPKTG